MAAGLAGLIMLASCGLGEPPDDARQESSGGSALQQESSGAAAQQEGPQTEEKDPIADQVLGEITPEIKAQLMDRYIVPYEYYAGGFEWDFADPSYEYDYDEDDLDDIQVHLEHITSAFGVSVLVRELPQEEQQQYIHGRSEWGIGYNLTSGMHGAVSAFYFGKDTFYQEDSPYGEDHYENGLPTANFQDGAPIDIALQDVEILPDGTVRAVVARTLRDKGTALMSAEYLMQPFWVQSPPVPLQQVYSEGDLAFRFLKVSDIPPDMGERVIVPIGSVEDLLQMAADVNSGAPGYLRNDYVLQADLDLTGVDWEPVGQYRKAGRHDPNVTGFGGVFDGGGHTVSGLSVHRVVDATDDPSHLGFFATIGRGGEVKNLNIQNCDILLQEVAPPQNALSAGGLAGTCYGTVSDCTVTGRVTGTHQVGGLIGSIGWASRYQNCTVDAQVTGTMSVGGFAGAVHNAVVLGCNAKGQVLSVQGPPWYDAQPQSIGGFTGSTVMGTVDRCQAAVEVKTAVPSNWVGGFVGYHQGNIVACRYDSALTANWEAADVIYNDAPIDLEGVPGLQF